mgnify:CR=1 FL=1
MTGEFSWATLIIIFLYFVALYSFIKQIKQNHHELYESFGGKKVWYSAPSQLKFFGFLLGFRYLKINDRKLTINAALVKLLLVFSIYFIFTRPIYFYAQL